MTNSPKPRKSVKSVKATETDESIMPVNPDISATDVETATTTPNTDNQEEKDMTDTTDKTVETVKPVIDPAMAAIRQAVLPVRDGQIARIAAIDAESAKVAGTLANKVKQAEGDLAVEADKALEGFMPDTEAFPALFSFIGTFETLHPICALQVISTILADVTAKRDELLETVKGLVSASLKATSSGSDEIAALKTERAALVVSVDAMSIVLSDPIVLPKAPKLLGGAGTATKRTVGGNSDKKVGSYYVLEADGTRTIFSKDTLSYLAFAYGVSATDLKVALGETGLSSLIVPFEQKVTLTAVKVGSRAKVGDVQTVTIGLDVSTASDGTDTAVFADNFLASDMPVDEDGSPIVDDGATN